MFNSLATIRTNQKGFTLTEVMIGMMILTVAIVSATNLLMGLIDSNKTAVKTMQAYYLAQEGVEAVRNVRDSNWLHNKDWLGKDSALIWGNVLTSQNEDSYDFILNSVAWGAVDLRILVINESTMGLYAPWKITKSAGRIYKYISGNGTYLSSENSVGSEREDTGFEREDTGFEREDTGFERKDTGFERKVFVLPYEEDCLGVDCSDAVLVRAEVDWDDGDGHFVLESIISNWKGGAL